MRMIDRLAWVRERVQRQRDWIAAHGGDLAGYIRHYGDPGVAPCDANGNAKTLSLPGDLGEIALQNGLRPVPDAPGCYYAMHFGSGGTLIYQADKDCLDRYERELAELEPRYGHFFVRWETESANDDREFWQTLRAAEDALRKRLRASRKPALQPGERTATAEADEALYALRVQFGNGG